MALPRGLPIVDHHCHLSPTGAGVAAAARFRAAGGTHLFLATQNYSTGVPLRLEDYRRQFEITEQLADRVRRDTGVVVYNVVAPYPIDLVTAAPILGAAAALEVHRSALDLAGAWVREKRAVALGEVGRAHFPVPDEVHRIIEEGFQHAFEVARDVGCPLVVHSADLDGSGYRELADVARRAGVPAGRVVKHYARSRVPLAERGGVVPSYLSRRELVAQVQVDPEPWFLETDFLDDPARPGAVLDLATVPRRALAIANGAPDGEARLAVPFVKSILKVYGLQLEVPARGVP